MATKLKSTESQHQEIKKREKEIFISGIICNNPPYYDVTDAHICIFKKFEMLKNFTCEQDPKEYHIREDELKEKYKKKYFCGICHRVKNYDEFKLDPELYDSKKRNISNVRCPSSDINETILTFKKLKIEKFKPNTTLRELANRIKIKKYRQIYEIASRILNKPKKIIKSWEKLSLKLLEPKILYNVSESETLIIPAGKLTNYQRFRIKNPEYKKSPIFNNCLKIDRSYIQY